MIGSGFFLPSAICLLAAAMCACVRDVEGSNSGGPVSASAVLPTPRAFDIETPAGVRWGFRTEEGSVTITPRFEAAGDFVAGQAPVRLEGQYVLVDATGTVKQSLSDATATRMPPLPSVQQASLEQYIEGLGVQGPVYKLVADPSEGEALLRLEVRRLAYGALEVRESGWEGESRMLVLPNTSLEQARKILTRLVSNRPYKDITGTGVFEGDRATYELVEPGSFGEFLRIREHRGGGIEIIHTRWFG